MAATLDACRANDDATNGRGVDGNGKFTFTHSLKVKNKKLLIAIKLAVTDESALVRDTVLVTIQGADAQSGGRDV